MTAAEQLVLRSESLELILLPEAGGRIHRLRADGHDLLRTPADPETHRTDPFFWGAYPMAPWCNRAPAGRRTVAGRDVALAPNFSDGSAIHGLVSSVPWHVDGPGRLSVTAGGDAAWPWAFAVSLDASVDDREVRLGYRLVNRSDAPMPAGLGLHPWFRAPLDVRLPADRVYPSNTNSDTEPVPVADTFDFRDRRRPAGGLDGTWTELREPRVELAWSDLGIGVDLVIGASGGGPCVALATPDEVGAVAIEPQTHGPDPLRRLERDEPDAPALLLPGEALALDLYLVIRPDRVWLTG